MRKDKARNVRLEQGRSVSTYSYDASRGALTLLDTVSTLPEGAPASGSTAEIEVHPDGTFLYVSNRGHDSLAVFSRSETTGRLTPSAHVPVGGKTPRHFAFDPSGRYVLAAHQGSDTISVLRVDATTGLLTPVGQPLGGVGKPVCVLPVRR